MLVAICEQVAAPLVDGLGGEPSEWFVGGVAGLERVVLVDEFVVADRLGSLVFAELVRKGSEWAVVVVVVATPEGVAGKNGLIDGVLMGVIVVEPPRRNWAVLGVILLKG